MKELLRRSSVLFLILVTVGALAISAFAAGTPTATLTSKGSAAAGEEIAVTVNINDAQDIRGIAITVVYDEMQYTLVSGEFLVSGVLQDFDVAKKDGVIAFSSATDINGGVLNLTFKVADNALPGRFPVRCDIVINDDNGSVEISATTEILATCKHSFTKKIVDNKYLCSKATCAQKAKYYYACEHCLEKGSSTFESGEKTAHTFDQKNTADKYAKAKETCTSKGTYYYSCVCGEKGQQTFETTATPSHKFSSALKSDKNSHWSECSRCGEKKDTADHVWNNGEITKQPTEDTEGEKTFTCTACGYKRTESIDKLPASDTSEIPNTSEFPDTSGTPEVSDCESSDVSAENSLPEQSDTQEESKADISNNASADSGNADKKGGAPWFVVIILALLAVAGWAAAAVLYIKQKK